MTAHAEEEMNSDGLTIFDVEHVILSGYVEEKQIDRKTGEPKYKITGKTEDGLNADVVVKFGTSTKVVIITVYLLEP